MVLALQDTLDMKDDSILKASSGLAGGIGRMEDVCGALLGASMMLGLQYGRGREELDDADKLASSTVPIGKLYKWFEKEFGTVKCKEVLTQFGGGVYYDRKVKWQGELAKEAGLAQKCVVLTAKTAAKTAEMILDDTE
ncbi:C-GCAxxG-C-C family protein [Chloroflexota bacterium]